MDEFNVLVGAMGAAGEEHAVKSRQAFGKVAVIGPSLLDIQPPAFEPFIKPCNRLQVGAVAEEKKTCRHALPPSYL